MEGNKKIIYTYNGKLLFSKAIIRVEEIVDDTFLFLEDGTKSKSVLSIDELEWELPKDEFIRVHPNHLINRNFTKKLFTVHSQWIELENGEKIPTTTQLIQKKNIIQKNRTVFNLLNSVKHLARVFINFKSVTKNKYHIQERK